MANNFSNIANPLYIRSVLNDSDLSSVTQVSSTPGGGQEDGAAFGWPSPPFFAIIDPNTASQEVIKVASKSGSGSTTQYTVTRGSALGAEAHGSTTKSHNAWAVIYPLWSAADSYNASAASDILFGGKTITNQTASNSALTIKEASGQSASILRMLTSAGTEYLKIAPGGDVLLAKAAPVFKVQALSGYGTIYISGGNQQDEALILQTNDNDRWKVMSDSVTESGGDTGSNFAIYRVTDAGSSIYSFTINRKTGEVDIPGTLNVNWVWSAGGFGTSIIPTQTYHLTNKEYVDYVVTSKLPLSGGSLSGNLSIGKSDPALWLDATGTGDGASIFFQNNGTNRWQLAMDDSGGFGFHRFNGAYVDTPLYLNADGTVNVPTPTANQHAATKWYVDQVKVSIKSIAAASSDYNAFKAAIAAW